MNNNMYSEAIASRLNQSVHTNQQLDKWKTFNGTKINYLYVKGSFKRKPLNMYFSGIWTCCSSFHEALGLVVVFYERPIEPLSTK